MANTKYSGRRKRLQSLISKLILVLGVVYSLLTIWYAYTLGIQQSRFTVLMVGIGLSLYYLMEIRTNTERVTSDISETGIEKYWNRSFVSNHGPYWVVDSVACIFWFTVVSATTGYVFFNFDQIINQTRVFGFSSAEAAMGILVILAATDATRRAYGNIVGAVSLAAVGYALFGPYFSGLFFHSGLSWQQVGAQGAMNIDGVYGFMSEVGVTWVAIFIIFAGMAKEYGLMDFVLSLSEEVSKSLKTGVVHVAIVSSMVMGSITGSAAANTATTGSFTIPMMKQQGIKDDFACAIEGVASSGGQILPPIMGVAAFLMADIVGVPFVTVIQSGIIPAALFYLGIMVAVQLLIYKHGWTTESGEFDRSIIKPGLPYLIPFVVLLYTLLWLRYSPLTAGLYTIITLVITMGGWNLVTSDSGPNQLRGTLLTLTDWVKSTIIGLSRGAQDMAPLIGILAALGVAVSLLSETGLTQQISTEMVSLAGGVFVVLLFLAMLTSLLFGLGMPTPAAYILVVILVAPVLIDAGVQELTAHFYVFYFAMLSAITPPVALTIAVGTQIAGSNFLQSCKHAIRIGLPGFIVPYAFVANESIIYWSVPNTVLSTLFVSVGIVALVLAVIGYDGHGEINIITRLLFIVAAVAAFFGPPSLQLTASSIVILWIVFNYYVTRFVDIPLMPRSH